MNPAWHLLYAPVVMSAGAVFGWWVRARFEKEAHTSSSMTGHLFDVIEARPHTKPSMKVGNPFSGISESTAPVDGTILLMRCSCGIWKTDWLPGAWTASDFHRTKPMDMDRAFDALTKQEKP